MEEQPQQKEVNALIRVRNRLANSPDSALAGIFTNLLPRLLSRFQSQEPSILSEVTGIFAHIEERLHLNLSTIAHSTWISTLVEALTKNESPTEGMFASVLPVLEIALSHCRSEDVPGVFAKLCHILQCLHTWLSNTTAEDYSDPFRLVKAKSLEATWARASWIVFDHILIHTGMRPVLDWQKDLGDTPPQNTEGNDCWIEPLGLSDEERSRYGATLHYLFLDVLLYRPNDSNAICSRLARYRCEFRRRLTMLESETPLPQNQFRHPGLIRGRRKRTTIETWTPVECSFFQVLQRNILQCAQTVLGDSVETKLLQVVTTGKIPQPKSTTIRLPASEIVRKMTSPKSQSRDERKTEMVCPADFALMLLFHVVGEATFKSTVGNVNSPIVYTTSNPNLQRESLPRGAWKRTFQFLQDRRVDFSTTNETLMRIFVPLVAKLSAHAAAFDNEISMETYELIGGKISPSQCFEMKLLCDMKQHRSPSLKQDIDQAIWDRACSMLSAFRDDQVRRHRRDLEVERQIPTATVLIHRNRQRLAFSSPLIQNAIRARKDAYSAVASHTQLDSILDQGGELCWNLALMILNCAVYDTHDEVIVQLQKACCSVLRCYQNVSAAKANRTQPLYIPIQRACSSSKTWIRKLAHDWTTDVIEKYDTTFARVVVSCMLHDTDETISNGSLASLSRLSMEKSGGCHLPKVRFTKLIAGSNEVQADLDTRISFIKEKEPGLDEDSAFFILKANHFSSEQALDELKQAKQCPPTLSMINENNTPYPEAEQSDIFCGVCFDVVSLEEAQALSCQHSFCKDCWKSLVEVALSGKALESVVDLTCLQHDCGERITAQALQSFAPTWAAQWELAKLKTFVNGCASYCDCPNPECSAVSVVPDSVSVHGTSCTYCNTNFCPSCGEGSHSPVSCTVLREYQRESNRHDAAVDEIENRIQDCPNCQQRIQKNGGCNHMTCTACGHEFCWLCLSPDWASHTCRSNLNWDLPETGGKFRAARQLVMHQEQSEANENRRLHSIDEWVGKCKGRSLLSESDIVMIREAVNELLRARKFLRFAGTALYGLSSEDEMQKYDEKRSDLHIFVERLNQLMDSVALAADEQSMLSHLRGFVFCKEAISCYEHILESYLATL